jgi:glutamate synthase domain-containing protein 3
LKSLVNEYVREKGNGDASEVLDDYMEYLHLLGYVIRRNGRSKAHQLTDAQKAVTIHLV